MITNIRIIRCGIVVIQENRLDQQLSVTVAKLKENSLSHTWSLLHTLPGKFITNYDAIGMADISGFEKATIERRVSTVTSSTAR